MVPLVSWLSLLSPELSAADHHLCSRQTPLPTQCLLHLSRGPHDLLPSRRCRRGRFNPWVGKIPWRRKQQPTPVFLPGEFHGQGSLEGYSPWGRKELDMTERLNTYPPTAWATDLLQGGPSVYSPRAAHEAFTAMSTLSSPACPFQGWEDPSCARQTPLLSAEFHLCTSRASSCPTPLDLQSAFWFLLSLSSQHLLKPHSAMKTSVTFLNSTPPSLDSTLIWLCSFSNMIYKLTSWAPSAYPSHSLQSVSIQPTPTLPNPVMHFGLISPTLDKASGTVSRLLLRPQVPSSPQPTPLSPSLAMLSSLLALCLSSSKCCSSLLNHFPCRCWFQLPDINPQLKFSTLRMITFPPSALTYISLLALSMLYLNCSFLWLSLASSWRAERML